MPPLFSVIIPTYNRRELLRRAIASVWAQTVTDYEVIVVDDGSSDGTWEELQALSSRVSALRQQNAGPGAARNLGVEHAQGEYLAFLDSDDLWFPWSLETYASGIREHCAPAFIAGKPFRFRDEAALSDATPTPVRTNVFPDYLASGSEWRWWGVSSFVIRTDALRAVGGFAEANINGEDADLAMRLGEARGFVQVCRPFTFGYREHAVSAMKNLPRTLEGIWHKVDAERDGQYPGSRKRANERRRILTRHVRPVTLDCLRAGFVSDAWRLYRTTFGWHLRLGRWKYLLGFPLKALARR